MAGLSACTRPEGTLHVSVELLGAPATSVEISAVPYDVTRVMDSLERASPDPRPTFPGLEEELLGFARADPDSLAAIHSSWAAARKIVADLAESLTRMGRDAPGYGSAYARFRTSYERLAREEAALERTMRGELEADRDLAMRAAAAADSIRSWERIAYRDFDGVARSMGRAGGGGRAEPVRAVTDNHGRTHLELPPGSWWLVARIRHPDNPFLEFAWNVPVVASGWVPVVQPMFTGNVNLRWRR